MSPLKSVLTVYQADWERLLVSINEIKVTKPVKLVTLKFATDYQIYINYNLVWQE